jgi:hypothetical protein
MRSVAKRIAAKIDVIVREEWVSLRRQRRNTGWVGADARQKEQYAKGFATLQAMGGASQSTTVPGTPVSVGSSATPSPSPKHGTTPLPEVSAA